MTGASFEMFESKDGWRWRLRARNGEVVAASEAYTRAEDAGRGARDAARAAISAAEAEAFRVAEE